MAFVGFPRAVLGSFQCFPWNFTLFDIRGDWNAILDAGMNSVVLFDVRGGSISLPNLLSHFQLAFK